MRISRSLVEKIQAHVHPHDANNYVNENGYDYVVTARVLNNEYTFTIIVGLVDKNIDAIVIDESNSNTVFDERDIRETAVSTLPNTFYVKLKDKYPKKVLETLIDALTILIATIEPPSWINHYFIDIMEIRRRGELYGILLLPDTSGVWELVLLGDHPLTDAIIDYLAELA